MPGIVGCTKRTASIHEVERARGQLRYAESYSNDLLFEDEQICCTRTHLNIIGESHCPVINETRKNYCWIEGEFFNKKELVKNQQATKFSEATLLLEAYRKQSLEALLQKIDGYFTAVIYDSEKQILLIFTDRYGFKPMYLWEDSKNFAFSSEYKTFLSFDQFKVRINKEALACFLNTDQMLGDLTWFSQVRRLNAATICTCDLKTNTRTEKRYWTWAKVQQQEISFAEASKKTATLFREAVAKRIDQEKIYIGLSGGLDSKAILAAAPGEPPLGAYTFGQKGAEDIRIAKKIAQFKNMDHQVFLLNKKNWLDNRLEGVWKTEGLLNLFHLHAAPFEQKMQALGPINLNGVAGGLILGGRGINNENRRVREADVIQEFGDFAHLQKWEDPFYEVESSGPYFLDARMRRFTQCGLEELGKRVEQRAPFLDNDLLEFIFSIPEAYRKDSRLFSSLYKNEFPAFYNTQPWEATGFPLDNSRRFYFFGRKIFRAVRNRIRKGNAFSLANYANWLEGEFGWIQRLLESPEALYRQLTPIDFYQSYVLPHRQKKANYTWEIGRAITLEIWLQQVFHNRFKNSKELFQLKTNLK